MMTPTRLRQIADRVEIACVESRTLRSGKTIPCEICKRAADDLREFAAAGWSAPLPKQQKGAAAGRQ